MNTGAMSQPFSGQETASIARLTEFDATLHDGRVVHIRPMYTSDEAELLQAFDRLSPEARYMRFMRAVREPNLERLRKTLASFPQSGDANVATVPAADGIDIVGTAMFVILSDPTACEFAINVAGDFCAVGLGSLLMETLIATARQRGLKEMDGLVLAANQPMLRLAARLGFTSSHDPDDATVRWCRMRLDQA